MKVLLVSSKTMNSAEPTRRLKVSQPQFINQAIQLMDLLKTKSSQDLKQLMRISDKLSLEVVEAISNWQPTGGTPAWHSFTGDVYRGLDITKFDESMLGFAQQNCYTISGLYGLLRPLDTIWPYRLEIGYPLTDGDYKNLYQFWGDTLANHLRTESVINLASEEYIKAFRPYVDNSQIITPQFLQIKNSTPVFQAFYAKHARGAMTRWICKNQITSPTEISDFTEDRYIYSKSLSTPNTPTFVRDFIPAKKLREQKA